MRPSWKQSGRKAMNIANWLQAQALQAPESPALYTGSECRATYHEFAARAAALSGVFVRDYGLRAGDRIALFMHNRVEYLIAWYAAWWIGAAVAPINSSDERRVGKESVRPYRSRVSPDV